MNDVTLSALKIKVDNNNELLSQLPLPILRRAQSLITGILAKKLNFYWQDKIQIHRRRRFYF